MKGKTRKTVGITDQGAQNLSILKEDTAWFKSEEDLVPYRLAISLALARRLPIDKAPLGGTTTKYSVASLDPDGRLRELVCLMAQGELEDPYEYAEKLADVGLRLLRKELVDEEQTLSDVIDPDSDGS